MEAQGLGEAEVQGLGVAGGKPETLSQTPQIIPGSSPAVFADWFQVQGGIGSVITITFCKHLFANNLAKETVNITLPNEVAMDLVYKLAQAYALKVEKSK